ncbi:MAG: sigma-70 family RNA polymerase sigma factor [Bryobacteraceae bacterium]
MSAATHSESVFAQESLTYLDGLYSYAMALTHSQTEAQDLVQETYLRAVRAFGQLAPDSNLKGWLYAILRNTWLNQVRHCHSGPRMVELDDDEGSSALAPVSSENDPYATCLSQAACEDVRAAVDNLPPQYREVIVLREFEGLTYQEIGLVVGIPPGTVMSRLGRARDRLRESLSQWGHNSKPAMGLAQGGVAQ